MCAHRAVVVMILCVLSALAVAGCAAPRTGGRPHRRPVDILFGHTTMDRFATDLRRADWPAVTVQPAEGETLDYTATVIDIQGRGDTDDYFQRRFYSQRAGQHPR